MSDLKILFPERNITVGGKEITVRPFPFGSIPRVIAILGNSISLLQNAPNLKAVVQGDGEDQEFMLDAGTIGFLVKVIGEGGDNIMELVAIASNTTPDFIKGLDPEEGLKLTYKCYIVNQDFFMQRLKPLLEVLMSGTPIA